MAAGITNVELLEAVAHHANESRLWADAASREATNLATGTPNQGSTSRRSVRMWAAVSEAHACAAAATAQELASRKAPPGPVKP